MAKNALLEIVAFNPESALVAQNAGADRIELCAEQSLAGIYPGDETVYFVRKNIKINLVVMIRPRGGNFIYTGEEFDEMKREILFCKKENCDGVVFGILDENNKVDKQRNSELVELAGPLPAVFHRAIDQTENIFDSLETIIECGFARILTSGGRENPVAGSEIIGEMVKKVSGRITIMPGGGVRPENISELKKKSGAIEFHSSALLPGSAIANENEIRKMKKLISK